MQRGKPYTLYTQINNSLSISIQSQSEWQHFWQEICIVLQEILVIIRAFVTGASWLSEIKRKKSFFLQNTFISLHKHLFLVKIISFLWQQSISCDNKLIPVTRIYLIQEVSIWEDINLRKKSSICKNKSFLVTRSDYLWQKITYIRHLSQTKSKTGNQLTFDKKYLHENHLPLNKTWVNLQFANIRWQCKTQLWSK